MKIAKTLLSLAFLFAPFDPAISSPYIDYGPDQQRPPQSVCDPDKVWQAATSIFFAPPVEMKIRGIDQRIPLRAELNERIGLWGDTRNGGLRFHSGIDVLADEGEVLAAPIDGVIDSGNVNGLGQFIDLNFEVPVLSPPALCKVHLRFAHLSEILVPSGNVSAGQVIGRIGRTGNSLGPEIPTHVHIEFWAIPQTIGGQNRKLSTRDPRVLFGW